MRLGAGPVGPVGLAVGPAVGPAGRLGVGTGTGTGTGPSAGAARGMSMRAARGGRKQCRVCFKQFPSEASMLIHRRTHTGEKPYVCPCCRKGFNVKSNLLRHLRTLHDRVVSPSEAHRRPPRPHDT